MADESPLSGGFVNEVVLKDGIVRRPLGPHDAYGLDRQRRGRPVETVLWWQDRCWRGIETKAAEDGPAMVRIRDLGAPIWTREDFAWVADHRSGLKAALGVSGAAGSIRVRVGSPRWTRTRAWR